MIEVTIKRPKDAASEALVQFAARRGYRMTNPWYMEGVRIEAPPSAADPHAKRGFWATISDTPSAARIDVELKNKRRATRVKISVSNHPDSIKLAYELQAYLNDERAYETECPPMCPTCGNSVPNPISRYCGRCGHRLVAGGDERPVLRPPPVVREHAARELPPPLPVKNERATEKRREAERSAIVVERDEAPTEAADDWNNESPAPLPEKNLKQSKAEDGDEADVLASTESADRKADVEIDTPVRAKEQIAEAESESLDGDTSADESDRDHEDAPSRPQSSRRLLAEE